jgi:hypothetical protein
MMVWKGRLYVPNSFRKEVLKQEHLSQNKGNFGCKQTMKLITRNFYWPNLKDNERKYCNTCDSCQQTKSPPLATHGQLRPLAIPFSQWTYLSVDLKTDLPESNGNEKIMVVVN